MDLFLFGAGASHDCGIVWPYNPPLGQHLYRHLVAETEEWALLPKHVSDLYASHDFEAATTAVWEGSQHLIPGLIRGMARYFAEFTPSRRRNNYLRVNEKYHHRTSDVVLATLNYDLLIELSIIKSRRFGVCFHGHIENCFTVLKVHGSPGFLPACSGQIMNLTILNNQQIDQTGSLVESPVNPVIDRAEIEAFCQANDVLAPAMGLYAPGKRSVFSGGFVEEIKDIFAHEVASADRIIAIGVSINKADRHIWEPLANSNADLILVGLPDDETSFEEWKTESGRAGEFYSCGFSGFVEQVLPTM